MEDFFDYLLGILLILLMGVIGLLIYFSIHAPLVAYVLASGVITLFFGGTILFLWKTIQKKQLQNYYPLLQSTSHAYKAIKKALNNLDRPIRLNFKFILLNLPVQERQQRIVAYEIRYHEHIRGIESSKAQYLQEIQEIIHCLHTIHAQLSVIRYSPNAANLSSTLSDTLDELLIGMEALRETE